MFSRVDFRKDEKKKRKKRRENIFGGCLIGERGGKKNWWGLGLFFPGSPICFLPKLGRKLKKKHHTNQRPNLPSLFSVSMHWVMLTLCCFFFFFSTSCLFIQSFKRLLLHFLAFPFSFSNQRWCYQMGAINFFFLQRKHL